MVELMIDVFGKRKIYLTNTHPNRAKPWILGIENWEKRCYDGWGDWDDYSISRDDNNVTTIKFNTVDDIGRFPILALPYEEYIKFPFSDQGVHRVKDQRVLRTRGYMTTREDWKNVEVTLYWILRETLSGVQLMGLTARGGPHHGTGGAFGLDRCFGTCYEAAILSGGTISITKELGHGSYSDSKWKDTGIKLMNKMIGMKGIFYTKANGNPYIELWLDKNADNNWELMLEHEDTGDWPIIKLENGYPVVDEMGNYVIKENECDGSAYEQITWGGPGVIFKINRLTKVDMKWASIREILPPEGWPIRFLLKLRGVPFPVSMRKLADEYGLTQLISLRELSTLEAERPRE